MEKYFLIENQVQYNANNLVLEQIEDKKLPESISKLRKQYGISIIKIKDFILQYTDRPSGNRRIYPYDVVQKAVSQIQPLIKARKFFGELDHKSALEGRVDTVPYPKLEFASHFFTKVEMSPDKKSVIGDAIVIPKDYGEKLLAIILSGATVSVSLRGLYSFESRNGYRYATDLELLSYDFVGTPGFVETEVNIQNILSIEQKLLKYKNDVIFNTEREEAKKDIFAQMIEVINFIDNNFEE